MTKPDFAICKQQKHRSACASSLISAFVVHCLDSIIPLVSISEISSLYLVSLVAQAGLNLPCSKTPKTDFLVMRLNKTILFFSFPSIKTYRGDTKKYPQRMFLWRNVMKLSLNYQQINSLSVLLDDWHGYKVKVIQTMITCCDWLLNPWGCW